MQQGVVNLVYDDVSTQPAKLVISNLFHLALH